MCWVAAYVAWQRARRSEFEWVHTLVVLAVSRFLWSDFTLLEDAKSNKEATAILAANGA